MTLQQDYTLQDGNYRILKVLGQGGFGFTYLAIQVRLDRKVAIKEFFMKDFCERNEVTRQVTLGTAGSRETVNSCRKKFLKEAKHIAKLDHPNIIRIHCCPVKIVKYHLGSNSRNSVLDIQALI